MNCQQVLDNYTAYRDYDLTETDRVSVEDHLMECQKCRDTYTDLDLLVVDLGSLQQLEVSSDFDAKLLSKISELGNLPESKPWYRLPTFRTSGYAIAAGVALALVFSQWMNPLGNEPTSSTQKSPVAAEFTAPPAVEPTMASNDTINNQSDSLDLIEPKLLRPSQPLHLVNQTP